MAHVELAYGRGAVPFEFEGRRFRVLEREAPGERPLTDAEVGAAIDDPVDSQPLEDILSPGESVLVVVSDATRATGSAQVVNLLVRRLIALGVAPYDLRIIFATGLHRAVTQEEKAELLSPFIVQRVRALAHDASDESSHVSMGLTERGTPIELDRALFEHSHVILTGAVGFHYFAGLTGGRKSVCPGLASRRTIEATHLHALDFERGGRRAGVGTGLLDGNAVHEECDYIGEMIAPSFSINTVVNAEQLAVKLYSGNWRTAHRAGCDEYLQDHSAEVDVERSVVIASCGGFPHDINMIQAHKTLDMAANVCRDVGT